MLDPVMYLQERIRVLLQPRFASDGDLWLESLEISSPSLC